MQEPYRIFYGRDIAWVGINIYLCPSFHERRNMRKLLYILIAVLLLPCCVHQPKNGVRLLLEEAEGMMRTCPDTAYFLLREIGATIDLETEADSAYHGLLLLEALREAFCALFLFCCLSMLLALFALLALL